MCACRKVLVYVLVALLAAAAVGSPEDKGKWDPEKYGKGGYVHDVKPYVHKKEPYTGGFGEYIHDYVPYEDKNFYKSSWKLYRRCRCW